jgi:DNA-binding transcriptional ArsR family regulator
MERLLPTGSETTVERDGPPALVDIDDDRAEEALAALQSETARSVFRTLNDDPTTPAALADDLDLSVQSVTYHLDNLREANLVEVHDTVYSEKGREMDVYGATTEPLLLFFGSTDDRPQLRSAIEQLASAAGPVALVVVVLKQSASRLLDLGDLV